MAISKVANLFISGSGKRTPVSRSARSIALAMWNASVDGPTGGRFQVISGRRLTNGRITPTNDPRFAAFIR